MTLELYKHESPIIGDVTVQGDKVVATHMLYFSLMLKSKVDIANFPMTYELAKIIDVIQSKGIADVVYKKNTSSVFFL